MNFQSNDYEKVGTKANARAWERMRKHAIEKREARERNPLLAQQADALFDAIIQQRKIAADAWGHHYPVDEYAPEPMQEFYRQYVDPLQKKETVLQKMLYCKHRRVDIGEECVSCRDCGAVDYGRGFQFHESMIATKTN